MGKKDWKKLYDEKCYNLIENYGSCLFCDGKEVGKYKIYSGGDWFGLGEKCLKNKEYIKDEKDWKQPHRKYLIEGKYGLLDDNEME